MAQRGPSEAPATAIAAATAWRAGEHAETYRLLDQLADMGTGRSGVYALFGLYIGLLTQFENQTGEDGDVFLRTVALDLALQREPNL